MVKLLSHSLPQAGMWSLNLELDYWPMFVRFMTFHRSKKHSIIHAVK